MKFQISPKYAVLFWVVLLVILVLGVCYLPINKNQTLIMNTSPKQASKNGLVMETKCKMIFENIYGVEFPKMRPAFLRNPETNKNLELDGYNKMLGIAFEYNGSQHYFYNPYFHKDMSAFENQVKHDNLKASLCKKHGIHLIVIPYHLRHSELETFIRGQLPTPL